MDVGVECTFRAVSDDRPFEEPFFLLDRSLPECDGVFLLEVLVILDTFGFTAALDDAAVVGRDVGNGGTLFEF